MPTGKRGPATSLAFNAERVRLALMDRLAVPPEMVSRALSKLSEKLEAKETKWFAEKGVVTDHREVENHTAQLNAVDKILTMAGLYVKEQDKVTGPPPVTIEVDPETGIVKLIVGSQDLEHPPSLPPAGEFDDASLIEMEAVQEETLDGTVTYQKDDEVQIIKKRDFPPEVLKKLIFGNG